MSHSIKDVAKRAGCSIATVSRVLSGKGYISDDARKKVEEAVEELGYRPNRVARSLRARKSRVIGLIVSDISNPFFSEISRAVERVAMAKGFSVLICNSDEDGEKEGRYLKLMDEEQVAGILLSPTRANKKPIDPAKLPPMVLIDRKLNEASLDAVLIDNEGAARRLTETLLAGGFQKIAGIFGGAKSFTAALRIKGFKAAFEGQEERMGAIHQAPAFEAEGVRLMQQILAEDPSVDAVVCSSALLATGAYKGLRESSTKKPAEMGFACFDDPSWASFVEPAVTVVRQPASAIGEAAADLLLKRIEDRSRPVSEVVLQGELVERESSGRH
ncbi:LacI family DNA-binding transcriptional regulator [Pelagicoccus sp. SDUM812002]|uniref:LacI family DNA-binding transcriptional regulator n=1 Tax=Pelagicoccus sp. SDUM812002 TaxID=3041266 RepID=UPI00280DA4EF|nr:LacI family DNA-binding transcriptional regulator [Pelagicoccus sp. SDUM812002]MDQ8188441.1 LacI family DNA-binding transcriptional regulator [Pelagicoccus sp. SDUM812002]